MTMKTTLSFTDRHHAFLKRKVEEGVYATTSAGVAAAVELMMAEAETQELARQAFREEIARRLQTPSSEYVPAEEAFRRVRAAIGARAAE